jgi:cold shock CspA family protein
MSDRRRRGAVTEFDADRGLGEITADDGSTYPFHCIEIADGSRSIDVGTRVTFTSMAKLGRYEAAAIASG